MRRAIKRSLTKRKGEPWIGASLAVAIALGIAATAGAEDAATAAAEVAATTGAEDAANSESTNAAVAQAEEATKGAARSERREHHRKAEAETATQSLVVLPTVPPAIAPAADLECRTMKVTGSRLPKKRVCATRAGWAEADALAKRNAEQMRRSLDNQSGQARPAQPYETSVLQ